MGKWILLFLVLPVVDFFLLIRLGRAIGGQNALLMSLASASVGFALARALGLRQMREWQALVARGRAPGQSMIEALLLLLAAAWLILPGVISDVLALGLLIPALRRSLAARAAARVLAAIERGAMQVNVQMQQPRVRHAEDVIDAEGETVEPEAESGRPRKQFTP